MKTHTSPTRFRHGFTLLETVIAIGVLAVLLTGFLVVFTPAAQGIRRSISIEQMQRLASTLESEMTTVRAGQTPSVNNGFEKAFAWIRDGAAARTTRDGAEVQTAIFVYQYRGNPAKMREEPESSPGDGTPKPIPITSDPNTSGLEAGNGYILHTMTRRGDDPLLAEDLAALEGSVYFVKTTQLVLQNGQLEKGTAGQIQHLVSGALANADDAAAYQEAVIAYAADFYTVPTKTYAYLTGAAFTAHFNASTKPAFSRNFAASR
jgi:prepilin-type N-terminal cleavage/methylation domain-containing protein